MNPLTGHTGLWVGTNRFRLMPDDQPVESLATAQLSVGAGGSLAVLTYTWAHPEDGEQEGLLVLGLEAEPGAVVGLWGDTWHQKPAAAQMQGAIDVTSVTVSYTYGEGWEWRITLTTDGPDVLRWRMDNVVPTSSAAGSAGILKYWAMDAELRRS